MALKHLVSLPLEEGLVLVGPDGVVYALDAAGRRLWEAVEAGWRSDDLVEACMRLGGLAAAEARSAIAQTLRSWRALGLLDPPPADPVATEPVVDFARPPGRQFALDAVFLVGERPVRLRCDDAALGELIDAACAWARADGAVRAPACVDLIERGGRFAVHADDLVLARMPAPAATPASARHRCLTAMLESARPGRRWLGILHAAAVAENGCCILLAGPSGCGKSTLGTALLPAGASFVSDDYAPLEQGSWRIWPVPYAPSVKRGSWQLVGRHHPALRDAPVYRHRGLEIRYLEVDEACRAPLDQSFPVRALVFPRFEDGAALALRRISPTEALIELCRAGSMLEREPGVLAETLRWIQSVPAHALVFGELEAGVEGVREVSCRD